MPPKVIENNSKVEIVAVVDHAGELSENLKRIYGNNDSYQDARRAQVHILSSWLFDSFKFGSSCHIYFDEF